MGIIPRTSGCVCLLMNLSRKPCRSSENSRSAVNAFIGSVKFLEVAFAVAMDADA
jgi:hypothetical protein